MDIGFAQNYTNLYAINTTPGAGKNYARVGAGINSVSWAGNEAISQDAYYDGDGLSSSDVTGGQIVGTFAGHRKIGDPAQDFISALLLSYGEARKTDFLWISPDGTTLEGECTVANINPQGGDPNAKSDFGFEIHYNGMPTYTPGDASQFPTEVSCEAVTVEEGATVAAEATVTPEGASETLFYAVDDDSIATVDAQGNVTGVKQGTCNLNIKSAVKPTVQKTVVVTVSAASLMSMQSSEQTAKAAKTTSAAAK